MSHHKKWIPIVLGGLVLAAAFLIFSRKHGGVKKTVKEMLDSARAGLENIKEKVKNSEKFQEAAAIAIDIRDDLRRAFAETALSQRNKWKKIDEKLEKLEEQIQEKKEEASETLKGIVEDLEDWDKELK